MNIIRIHFPEFRNDEYPLVVSRFIDVVEKHNPAALRIGRSFERLTAFRPQLAKIEVQERADRDSALLLELDRERNTLLKGIRAVAKAFLGMTVEALSAPAAKLLEVLDRHGSDIAQDNYTAKTKRIDDLSADASGMPDAAEILGAISLKPAFERLNEVNRKFDRVFMHRTGRRAETERVDIRAIRRECDKAIVKLWDAVEYNIDEYGEEDYRLPVAAVNALSAYYRQQLAIRATRRKNGKDAGKEEPVKPEEEQGGEAGNFPDEGI
jgi:hypothetical protein